MMFGKESILCYPSSSPLAKEHKIPSLSPYVCIWASVTHDSVCSCLQKNVEVGVVMLMGTSKMSFI